MKIALYVGNHAGDTLPARLGWRLTRKVQKGPYANITHVEAIHKEHDNGEVTIASASIRDGGVRSKRVFLESGNWIIVDVPSWDVTKSVELLQITNGYDYDWRGAIATVFLGSQDPDCFFCNEWVGEPYLAASGTFGPHQFAAIAISLGRVITSEFFNKCDALRFNAN